MSGRRCMRRFERGAAAVEGAIVTAAILVPLLLGVVSYGQFFWDAQKVRTLDVAGIPQQSVSGTYTCSELVSRVKSLLTGNVTSLANQVGVAPGLVGVVVDVVNVVPTIGADVRVSLRVPLAGGLSQLLPLPNGGAVIQDVTQRLTNVKVTSSSC